ncbi:ATP cone domain-containing protein [Segetibacter sp.]|uniref:ATP cone domain-containing protein n=1 Tax=Segetibacter sp. TaxID=2231182 RepID=UPI00261E8379|nr:ATP cone domain-containing protein [Segetibacter sp.]MCW3081079.1 ATP-cone domain protein [Segetibacter sp.]
MTTEKNRVTVTKASGQIEPFSIKKLRHSLSRAKATPEEINSIVETLLPKLYQGISTQKIYSEAFQLLTNHSKTHAARYHLKRGIMELGPSGFPFEIFIGELFKHQGFSVQVGKILQGKCVTHEIDVIAEKDNQLNLMECKYRNQPGMAVDVKTPIYINSRFEDVLANVSLQYSDKIFAGWVVTNSRFTTDAIAYGNCKGMQLLSWDYPFNNSLKDWVDRSGLYPLTCLTSLARSEKEWLLAKGYVLVKDIYDNEQLLLQAGVKKTRIKGVMDEGVRLI